MTLQLEGGSGLSCQQQQQQWSPSCCFTLVMIHYILDQNVLRAGGAIFTFVFISRSLIVRRTTTIGGRFVIQTDTTIIKYS